MTNPRYVFVHLPKTAGTSLSTILNATFPVGSVSPPLTSIATTSTEVAAGLDDFDLVTGHLSWQDIQRFLPDRACFTVLREPVDRCLSLYAFFRGHAAHPLIPLDRLTGANDFVEATSLARQLDPEEFFRFRHPALHQAVWNRMAWQLGDHARPECRSLASDQEAFERAVRHLDRFFFTGISERIDRDLGDLLRAIGMPVSIEMPRRNMTANPLRRADVGSETLKAIERITEYDRRLYDAVCRRVEAGDAVRKAA